MAKAGGYILIVSPARREELLESAEEYGRFAEAVPEFVHSNNAALVCFVSFDHGLITHIAKGRRGRRAATGLQRLNVDDLVELDQPLSISAIKEAASPRVAKPLSVRLNEGGMLPPASFTELVEIVSEMSLEASKLLARYSEERLRRIARLSPEVRDALAEQKDAVATALNFAGIDRAPLADWSPPDDDKPPLSYLDGLDGERGHEDRMVFSDLLKMPGFDQIRDFAKGSIVFENDQTRLTVTIANHFKLEEQLGVDLIYFNERYRSFVMVQYKVMEQDSADSEAIFRIPNDRLAREIDRMEVHLKLLQSATANTNRDGFRLLENPFFLKFCPRLSFDPDDTGLIRGMYLPLAYWKLTENDPRLAGKRGGQVLRNGNAGRYFTNTDFSALVAKAWIGTNSNQSDILEPLIREIIQSGRTVALAIEEDGDSEREAAFDPAFGHD